MGEVTHLIVDLKDVSGVANGTYLAPFAQVALYDTKNIKLDVQQAKSFVQFDNDPETARAQLSQVAVRSSEYVGYDVVGPSNTVIATIEDLVVDLETNSWGLAGISMQFPLTV